MEWDIASLWDMGLLVFPSSTDIDEFYGFWSFLQERVEFAWCDSEHGKVIFV
jgi:hypothetical protein